MIGVFLSFFFPPYMSWSTCLVVAYVHLFSFSVALVLARVDSAFTVVEFHTV